MFNFLRDTFQTLRLRARYQRLMQEKLIELAESSPQPISEDPGRWTLLGASATVSEPDRKDLRDQARQLSLHNPHARNLLRLLEIYVAGPGFQLNPVATKTPSAACTPPFHSETLGTLESRPEVPIPPSRRPGITTSDLLDVADTLWKQFLAHNQQHYSFREQARRSWRDGESFVRVFPSSVWPPAVRFVDPECIGPTQDDLDSQGVLTDPQDVETPLAYLRSDPRSGELIERIPADEILHTRIGVDSNQKRGVSLFAPIVDTLSHFDKWLDTEMTARRLQASIVLWRKVQGSPSQVAAFSDAGTSSNGHDAAGSFRRERCRPGTILTTSHGTDLQYLQPDTNFGDAVPLGRLLLLSIAAGGGVPEFMLTSDASNANFASTMVAEGPAVKLFQAEQQFFAAEFERLWKRVMTEAIRLGYLPERFFDFVHPEFTFPQLVNRDRAQERTADARLIDARVLSRAEVARREGVDPVTMRTELDAESKNEARNAGQTPLAGVNGSNNPRILPSQRPARKRRR